MSRFLIIGNAPFVPKEVLQEACRGAICIALDGAIDGMQTLNMQPDILLGDMDSVDKTTYQSLEELCIVPNKDPNKTDLMKAIEYADSQQACAIDLICVTGHRFDHTLMNLRALKRYHQRHRPMRLITDRQTLYYVHDTHTTIEGCTGQPCGIMAFPEAYIDTQGLVWDVHNHPLIFAESESVCNRLAQPRATVTVRGHALIIAPGHLSTQHPSQITGAQHHGTPI